MNSSTGFKKRNLLRPPSGILNKEKQFLKAVDLSQSEPVIAAYLKGEISGIQEEINLLDKDKKIRQGESSLQKSYTLALKKWLAIAQTHSEKEDDDGKILKYMGVDNYESGFRKLWKVISNLDLMISKITELQIVQFLLYDELFDQLGSDSQRSSGLLSGIAKNGYSSGSFQITQVILDRSKDLFIDSKKKINLAGKTSSISDKNKEETQELINQLKHENNKLNQMIEQMIAQREKDKARQAQRIKENQQKHSEIHKQSTQISEKKINLNESNPNQIFKQIEDKYSEQIRHATAQRSRSEQALLELKIILTKTESELKMARQQLKNSEFKTVVAKSGSYEEALVEQMQKMKLGFEKRIALLTDDFIAKQKDLRKKQTEYKNQNQKIKWEKSLLLKKFEACSIK